MSNSKSEVCPPWAVEMIDHLKQMEMLLGHIPQDAVWKSQYLAKLNSKSFHPQDEVLDDEKAEFLFRKIVKGLHSQGFSLEQIVNFINDGLAYPKGLKYCDVTEAEEALKT